MSLKRTAEILAALQAGQTFACHKHLKFEEDDEGVGTNVPHENDQHCAGAMILLAHIEQPNQWMQIGSRLGFWDEARLLMDSPVYKTPQEMLAAIQTFYAE